MVKPLKLKKEKDIELLRESGSITSEILRELAGMAKPGVSLMSLEKRALEILESHKFASSAFLDYLMEEDVPYPAVTNLSVNEIAIHGIPSEKIVLQNGDVLSIDTGVDFKWRITDAAVTVPVGDVSPEVMKLMRTTYEATLAGIEKIRPGNLISDIYKTVTNYLLDRGYATAGNTLDTESDLTYTNNRLSVTGAGQKFATDWFLLLNHSDSSAAPVFYD